MYYDRPRRLGVVLFRNVGGGKQDYDRLAVDILSSLVTRRANEIQADIDKRFKEQAASPGSEGAVRRLIGELRAGKPNYDLMGSDGPEIRDGRSLNTRPRSRSSARYAP
jgi:hypothetical protein